MTAAHGTTTAYQNGCSCQDCKAANAAARRAWRAANGDLYGRAHQRAAAEVLRRYRTAHPKAWKALIAKHRAALTEEQP